jgi:hypothetical protein
MQDQSKLQSKKANKFSHKRATQLLMQALAHKNVPFNFVTSPAFQEYVDYVSESKHHAPTRWDLVKALEEICDILAAKTQKQMSDSLCLAVCADSWSSAGRHLTAVTGGNPGLNVYLNSYENLGSEDAQSAADAIQGCLMTSLGFQVDMDPQDANFPTAKVAVMTSDTTALMPATARALGTSKLCKGMQWAPCLAHVANLLLLDQLKVPAIASLLAHAKQIAKVFRAGNFRKLFLLCAFLLLILTYCTVLPEMSHRTKDSLFVVNIQRCC